MQLTIITQGKAYPLDGKLFYMAKFDVFTQVYTQNGAYPIIDGCNAIMITNIGADVAVVDGRILYPGTPGSSIGDSITIGGNEGETYGRQIISITFQTTVNPKIEVTQKYFI